jgi:hypothetical protein
VLTKRSANMRAFITDPGTVPAMQAAAIDRFGTPIPPAAPGRWRWPLSNVWLGVSAEDQPRADLRIRDLQATPAKKRFVSYEPALGPLDLDRVKIVTPDGEGGAVISWDSCLSGRRYDPGTGMVDGLPAIDWVIAGGESGPGARPAHPDWFRAVRDQCATAGVPFFFKQWGAWLSTDQKDAGAHTARARIYLDCTGKPCHGSRSNAVVHLVGKKAAGALLDGCEYRAFPA